MATVRLREARLIRSMSAEKFAEELGISESYLYRLERGEKRLNEDILRRLKERFRISADWVLGYEEVASYPIPLLGTIRAGLPIFNEGNVTGYIEVPSSINADFAVQIEGDSMSWVGIDHGDIALCRITEYPHSGQIVAVSLGEEGWGATIKFYVEKNGKRWLCAANPAYEDIPLDGREYRIAGVAVKFIKEVPSYYDYQQLLASYIREYEEWTEVIAEARGLGLGPQDVMDYLRIVGRHKA